MGNVFDSANYPTTEPQQLIAGDRWAWKRTDLGADYAPASYSLKYSARLEGAGSTEQEITASESGNDYIVEVSQATTAAITAGVYHWQAYITRTSDSERITVDSGTWEVIANRDAATTDPRTHAKIMLDNIESMLETKAAGGDVSTYTIAGRQMVKMSPDEITQWRNYYLAEVQKEANEEAAKNGKASDRFYRQRYSV